MKRVTFIRPNLSDMRSSDAMEPMVFSILAGLTPPGWIHTLYDERVEPIPHDDPADLVAITVETYTARRAYAIAARYRERGIPVVMGGYHATLLPEEVREHCDAVVLGDAEGVWREVLDDASNGCLQGTYQRPHGDSLTYRPDRRIFAGKRYAPLSLIQYGRGCRFACDFCSIHAFYGTALPRRRVEDVAEEAASAGRRVIFFVDDNLFSNRKDTEALLRALVPLRIRWACQVSIDIADDDALLDLMAESGCFSVTIGFESLNGDNLRQMRKQWNLSGGGYEATIRKFRARGIMIYGTFVFGYDQDTAASFDTALDFATRSGFYLANFNPLTPTPGTSLYRRLEKENRLLHDRWWLAPGYRYGEAAFRPARMSPEELTEGCYRARRGFYEYGSMLRRAASGGARMADPYRAGVYLLSNLVSRREIRRKQGIRLGEDLIPALAGAPA